MKINLNRPVLLLLAAMVSVEGRPEDWPQWRGPRRDGISSETGLLKQWPADGPPLAWKSTGLGDGYSSVAVANGRIFTMGNQGKDEYVLALNEKDGKIIWSVVVGPVRANGGGYPGPRCTPTIDGDLLYAIGINGDIVCLEVSTGKERWRKEFRKDFRGEGGGWGYSESPLVDGDRVVCTPGGKEASLVALNKKTGALIWKSSGGDVAAYSSIIIGQMGTEKQYIQFMRSSVFGVSARDGKLLWSYRKPANGTANIATPIFSNGFVFAASSYGTGGGLVKLVPSLTPVAEPEDAAKEVYFTKQMKNHHGGLVLLGEYLYGSDESILRCLKFSTGESVWDDRTAGKSSLVYADGHLIARNENGPVTLVEASPKGYFGKGRFQQPDRSGKNTWPHPVVANGRLYLRDQDVLLSYNIKQ